MMKLGDDGRDEGDVMLGDEGGDEGGVKLLGDDGDDAMLAKCDALGGAAPAAAGCARAAALPCRL